MKPFYAMTIIHPNDIKYIDGLLLSLENKIDFWVYLVDDFDVHYNTSDEMSDIYRQLRELTVHRSFASIKVDYNQADQPHSFAVLRNKCLEVIPNGTKVLAIDADERVEYNFSRSAFFHIPLAAAVLRSYHSSSSGKSAMVDGTAFRLFDRDIVKRYRHPVHEELVFDERFLIENKLNYAPQFIIHHLGYDLTPDELRSKRLARIQQMSSVLALDPGNLRMQEHLARTLLL